MKLDSMDDWRRTLYTADVKPELDGEEVTLFGWVQEIRDLGAIKFVILQDRQGTVQITLPKKKVGKEILEKVDALQTQYCIGVKGTVKKTAMSQRGFEIIPKEIKILGIAGHPLPRRDW